MVKTYATAYLSGENCSETRAAAAAYGHKISEMKHIKKPETIYQACMITQRYGIEGVEAPSYKEWRQFWK